MTPVAIGDIQRTQGTLKTMYNAKNHLRHLFCVYTERTTYFLDFNAQYENSKDMGPWNLFDLDKFTEKKLKGMVDMLPALSPMNYDNLNRRIGELDDYPLEIPVAILAIILVVSIVFLVATLVVYAYIIFRLRKNIKILFPMAKLLTGQATGSEA